jgi:hypothetical protein
MVVGDGRQGMGGQPGRHRGRRTVDRAGGISAILNEISKIDGLLHLLGWDHPDDASLEAMLARQDQLVKVLAEP